MRNLVLLLTVAIAFSGCSEEPTTNDGPTSTGEPDPPTTPGDNTTHGVDNAAPTLAFTADLMTGEVPFNVTLSIAGTDADGDALDWTVARNGTQVGQGAAPGNLSVQIAEPGNHTFTATVTDGNASVNATLTIVATGTAGYAGPDPLVYTGQTTGFDPLSQVGEGCWITYLAAPTGEGIHMGDDRGGWSYALADPSTHVAIFYDAENVAQTGDGTSGQVPAGSHYVDVCASPDGAAGASFTLTIYPPGHPDAQI